MPTVAEDVAFSLRRSELPRAEVDARVHETLDRFGLAGHADHPAHLLSGGQKQLLALAVGAGHRAGRAGLRRADHAARRRATPAGVADLLAELPQQVVLVTHHLRPARGFDRVLVVDEGRVVADDAPPAQALAGLPPAGGGP